MKKGAQKIPRGVQKGRANARISPEVERRLGTARLPVMRSLLSLLVLCFACSATAFVAAPAGALTVRPTVAASPAVYMGTGRGASRNKKAKAACRKMKSSRAAAKRFKVTSTGKLLRHYAGKAHLLRKKRPQHLAKLRRVGNVDDAELQTYQKLLLVFPKCATPLARLAVQRRRHRVFFLMRSRAYHHLHSSTLLSCLLCAHRRK